MTTDSQFKVSIAAAWLQSKHMRQTLPTGLIVLITVLLNQPIFYIYSTLKNTVQTLPASSDSSVWTMEAKLHVKS